MKYAKIIFVCVLALVTGCVSFTGLQPSDVAGIAGSPSSSSTISAPRMGSLPTLRWGGDLAGSTMVSQSVSGLTGSAGVVTASAGTLKETGATLTVEDSTNVARDVLDMAHGRITSGGGGTDYSVVIGPRPGAETSSGSLHILPHGTALTATNYQFAYDGAQSYFNNPSGGSLSFQIGASPYLTVATETVDVIPPVIEWGTGVSSPTLKQVVAAGAAQPMLVQAQSAGGTNDGGSITVAGGAPAGTGTVYGSTVIGTPLNISELTITPIAGANSLTAAQSAANVFLFGTQASAFTINIQRRIADKSLVFVRNPSGNGTATISYLTGATVTVAAGTSALIVSDGTNLQKIMSGT